MSRATTRAIGPADKKLIGNPDHDAHAAGLYRAMALRFYARYVDMRSHAEFRGGDLEGHGPLCTSLKASEQYQLAIEEWLWEPAETASASWPWSSSRASSRLTSCSERSFARVARSATRETPFIRRSRLLPSPVGSTSTAR